MKDATESPAKPMHVVFGIPSKDSVVSLGFLRSWTETQTLLRDNNINSSTLSLGGDPFIAKARNRIATDFLRECPDGDVLFFLDDDVDWPAEKVVEFLKRPEGVIAGIYPQKSAKTNFPVELACYADTGELITKDGLHAALLVPAGFLCIKRWVLEKLALPPTRPFLDTLPDGTHKQYLGIFECGIAPDDGQGTPFWWGEDYVFSKKSLNLGIDIWVDVDIKMGHVGKKRWEDKIGDHMDVYRRRAKLATETNPQKLQDQRMMHAIDCLEAAK